MTGNFRSGNPPQIKPLTTRDNRRGHFLHIGGRKDKFHVRRGLLQRLQQGVKRRGRQHVHLVHDVELILRSTRRHVSHILDNNLPNLVHLSVRRRVELHHIQRVPVSNLLTKRTNPTGRRRWPVHTVQRLRKNPRRTCLPRPPRPHK